MILCIMSILLLLEEILLGPVFSCGVIFFLMSIFWTSLDRAVELFVLMDAHARTGRRKKGKVASKD